MVIVTAQWLNVTLRPSLSREAGLSLSSAKPDPPEEGENADRLAIL